MKKIFVYSFEPHNITQFISSNCFLLDSLGFSIYNIMSPANCWQFTFSFPIGMPFISFSCLLARAKTPSTMVSKSGKSGQLLSMTLVVGLLYMASVMLKYISFTVALLSFFHHKWMLISVKCFSCSYWDNHMIFILHFVLYHIDWFVNVDPATFISRINPTWSCCMILLTYCWIQFTTIFWEFLHLYSTGILSVIFFSFGILVWFWDQGNSGFMKWVWSFHPPLLFFQRVWER